MPLPSDLVMLISSVGAMQSCFLAIYVFSHRRGRHIANLLLGFLFMALAIRVAKSVLWTFWPDTPLWLINFGFAWHLATGPLLLLYMYHTVYVHKKFNKYNLLHFLPLAFVLTFSFILEVDAFWYKGGYSFLLYHQLVYLSICLGFLIYVIRERKEPVPELDHAHVIWLRNLLIGVSVWHLAYFSNYILGLTSYLLGTLLYSVIIYLLSFYGFRHQRIFIKKEKEEKYKNLNISPEASQAYRMKLLQKMEEDKAYLDPDMTLSKLAGMLATSAYILSHIINDEMGCNFSEFINTYRIKDAQAKLKEPSSAYLKISSIAYTCGFNSLSSFNAAFKKITGMTPSAYKNRPL